MSFENVEINKYVIFHYLSQNYNEDVKIPENMILYNVYVYEGCVLPKI